MASEPDVSAKSAVTVPISISPKRSESGPGEPVDQAGPIAAPEGVEPPEAVEPVETAPAVRPSEAVEPVEGVEPVKAVEPHAGVAAGSTEIEPRTEDEQSEDEDGPTDPASPAPERPGLEQVVHPPVDVEPPASEPSAPEPDSPPADAAEVVAGTTSGTPSRPKAEPLALKRESPLETDPARTDSVPPDSPTVEVPKPAVSIVAVPESAAPTAVPPVPVPESPPTRPTPISPAATEHRAVRTRPARTRAGGIGVTIVLVAAGLLFTTSATTARGTQLRSERADLADLIEAEDLRVQTRAQRVAALNDQVTSEAAANSANNQAVKSLERSSADVVAAAGLKAVHGPGLTITLDDAPRDGTVAARVGPDDLVVHQQDVQAVVNALWAGGAEAMMLQDQRVISTSAVRCVGNTLILQGRVYSPPYKITAIGDVQQMQNALDSSPQIAYYLQYVASLRLGWSVQPADRINLPAYAGSLTLSHARVADSGVATSSGSAGTSSP